MDQEGDGMSKNCSFPGPACGTRSARISFECHLPFSVSLLPQRVSGTPQRRRATPVVQSDVSCIECQYDKSTTGTSRVPHSEADRNLFTCQNPASSGPVADLMPSTMEP